MSHRQDGDKGLLKTSRVFLVGFMCSGKSSVGRVLADKLGWRFIDLDEVIEREERMSIPDIFAKKGEEYFRRLELKTLKRVSEEEKVVVSTGGGLGANPKAMDMMKEKGLVVWLKVSFEEFLKRCGEDPSRPMIALGEEKLRDLMRDREKTYARAHVSIDNMGIEESAEKISLLLK